MLFAAVLALKKELGDVVDDKPLSFDTLLSLRGLVDFREAEDDAEAQAARNADVLAGFAAAVEKLKDMRERKGRPCLPSCPGRSTGSSNS